jgi:YVTN family beta-propeller protein
MERDILSFMRIVTFFLAASMMFAGSYRIYVANSDGDDITVIDPVTYQVVDDIKVSANPHGIVSSPDKSRFYISSESKDVLDVLDRHTNKIIRKVPLGRRPNNVAITRDGKRVYVCIRQETVVAIVDTGSLEVIKRVEVGHGPHNVYLTPDGKYMLATAMDDKKITAIDVKTETPAFEIPVGGVPRPLAIDAAPDGTPKRLFVQLSNLHGFAVVDYASRNVTRRVLLPDAPAGAKPLIPETFSHGIGIAPDGQTLWVNSLLDNSVSVFSMPGLDRLATIPVGHGPDWLVFTPDSKRCFVSNAGSNSVSVMDVAARKEIAKVPVGKIPKRIICTD